MNPLAFVARILSYFNLEPDLHDHETIHESIRKDIVFKGTNLWILMFAIIVASVGLNMNSTAVIIGAMLISPLMGPINGMGYSVATYNFPLFQQAIKNFGFAVLASLVASTSYFFLTPISTAHSELLARTSPTIYDVLIALFGGMAGVVAISSKQKGNVIPGVAIATALMPPLCTAGYGLATFQLDFFFGAFYLFTINTVFIAISSILISQILKFPIRTVIDEKQKKRVNSYISLVIALVAIPSIYFGYNLVQKEKFLANANRYVSNVSVFEGHYLLKNEINPDEREIKLTYGGVTMKEDEQERIIERAKDFELEEPKITIKQGLVFEAFDIKNAEIERLRAEIFNLNQVTKLQQSQIDSFYLDKQFGKQILAEIQNLYPIIKSCSYAQTFRYTDSLEAEMSTKLIVFGLDSPNQIFTKDEKTMIEKWMKVRLKSDDIMVLYSFTNAPKEDNE
ncbi:MAG: DUF389 domain-containing protein [Bacteroidales bacterium]|nr:DUF389 domain-containing protein [Bacteroidales bacterium]